MDWGQPQEEDIRGYLRAYPVTTGRLSARQLRRQLAALHGACTVLLAALGQSRADNTILQELVYKVTVGEIPPGSRALISSALADGAELLRRKVSICRCADSADRCSRCAGFLTRAEAYDSFSEFLAGAHCLDSEHPAAELTVRTVLRLS